MKLNDKVAVVTGAAQGIGKATALTLARQGAKVVVADLNASGAEGTVAEIISAGGEAVATAADVSNEHDAEAMIALAITTWGRLDILVNNAHSAQMDDIDIVSTSRETWDKVFAGTLFGVVNGCKFGIPAMLRTGGGSIINFSSNATKGGDYVRVAYGAAKAGVVTLSDYVTTVYGKQGIRCNILSPGVLVTFSMLELMPASLREVTEDWVPAPRMGNPQDAANLVAYLASDEASFINGQTISVDGGLNTPLGVAVAMRHAGVY